MSTVIYFGIPAQGHINPSFLLVKELVKRGERVFYYSNDEFRQKIELTGAIFKSYGDCLATYNQFASDRNFLKAGYQLNLATIPLIEKCLPEARELQPDYIIQDTLSIWGYCIAQLLHVPSIGSLAIMNIPNQALFTDFSLMRRVLPQMFQAKAEMGEINRNLQRIAETYSVKKLSFDDSFHNDGEITFVYTSRYFQIYERKYSSKYIFVGIHDLPIEEDDNFVLDQTEKRPLIYISFGTVFNDQIDFFKTCIQAFAHQDLAVVIALGNHVDPQTLGELPENILMRPYVPQRKVLQRANLFITHGGMNSVQEALLQGVPMLLFPQVGDQFWISKRAAQLGAGKLFWKNNISPERLRNEALRVMSKAHYAQKSKQIGETLLTAGGVMRAANEIEAFKATHGIGSKDVVSEL